MLKENHLVVCCLQWGEKIQTSVTLENVCVRMKMLSNMCTIHYSLNTPTFINTETKDAGPELREGLKK